MSEMSELRIRTKRVQRRIDLDLASIVDSSAEGSFSMHTEYGFALKRFLLSTETVFEDEDTTSVSPAQFENVDVAETIVEKSRVENLPIWHGSPAISILEHVHDRLDLHQPDIDDLKLLEEQLFDMILDTELP